MRFVGRAEDAQLLVMTPPRELVDESCFDSCVCVPILPRNGGLLLAVPLGFFTEEAVLAGNLGDEQGLLGPSKPFSAPTVEEDEYGFELPTNDSCTFLVIDVLDRVLPSIREYDPVVDPTGEVHSFVEGNPLASVLCSHVLDEVRAWLGESDGVVRMNFYSAREEQESPPAPKAKQPAKHPSKKVSNAQLSERVEALTTQLQLLASQQEALLKMQQNQATSSATPVATPRSGAPQLGQWCPQ